MWRAYMKHKLRSMLVIIEINLILWLAVCGMAWAGADRGAASWWSGELKVNGAMLLIGAAFAALVQHWGYYALRKEVDRQ